MFVSKSFSMFFDFLDLFKQNEYINRIYPFDLNINCLSMNTRAPHFFLQTSFLEWTKMILFVLVIITKTNRIIPLPISVEC